MILKLNAFYLDVCFVCFAICVALIAEKFEDTKRVIRSCKSKKCRQNNGKRKRTKGMTIYETIHRKQRIKQCEHL